MKYFTFILILSLFGCSISSKKSETPYSGQNIESKDVARKYYGVTTKKLGENEFQLYVVVRLVTNWDLKIKAAYMRKASELCNDAFDLEVFRSR
jgi:hypothetical protein